eukprot:m.12219 g.12219  ORF g.12219 m.12219 type:complete len:646 (-) comp9220_c0_seq1:120-2057(-)
MGNICQGGSSPTYEDHQTTSEPVRVVNVPVRSSPVGHAAPVVTPAKQLKQTPSAQNDKWTLRTDGVDGIASEARSAMIATYGADANISDYYYGAIEPEIFNTANQVGSGGTATVFQVKQKGTHYLRALKQVNLSRFSPIQTEMLLKEIEIGKILDHPNTIKVIKIFKAPDVLYVVMELCSGGDLGDELAKQPSRRFKPERARPLAAMMLRSLAYLHANNIVHRDIKLDNFVFTSDRVDADLKLIDFGVSRQFIEGDKMTRTTGTPVYMAPEVVAHDYTKKVDIWSFGVTLFTMLCGRLPPFELEGLTELESLAEWAKTPEKIRAMLTTELKSSGLNDECCEFVTKCMEVDVEKRFSAAEALASPWICSGIMSDEPESATASRKLSISNMSEYAKRSSLQKLGMMAVTVGLPHDKAMEVSHDFEEMDLNKDGVLSFDEFRTALEKKTSFTPEVIREMFTALDMDKTNLIKYSEFVAATMGAAEMQKVDNLEAAFHRLDIDDNGYITNDELTQLLPPGHTREHVDQIIALADDDGNGKLCLGEFIALMNDEKLKQILQEAQEKKEKQEKQAQQEKKEAQELREKKEKQEQEKQEKQAQQEKKEKQPIEPATTFRSTPVITLITPQQPHRVETMHTTTKGRVIKVTQL